MPLADKIYFHSVLKQTATLLRAKQYTANRLSPAAALGYEPEEVLQVDCPEQVGKRIKVWP